ncbi:glycoside hydrolase family 30 protein [Saccharospirillum mangrovi]|uniref:glycoside hydrolase family 30 protein n=1 Tax=Saccharospirillum mangrovi TaxID=2161747 RepID=UPI000D357415|nr:glycoside hydrolase family 30 protein [Saccharospirillum mangrovi]
MIRGFQSQLSQPERTALDNPKRLDSSAPQRPRLDLNRQVRYQTHLGFGGAFTEAAAVNYAALSAAEKRRFMDGYFSPDQHAYSLCRVHLNSCDFALGNWACQPSEDAEFSLQHYQEAIFPMIRDAQATLGRPIDLLVSPWSPPAWMKTNGQMNQGGQLKAEYRDAWAQQYVQFIQGLKAEGFSVWGVSVQNEPDATQSWDSCRYNAVEERDFIRDHLGPALHQADLADVRLLCWDHNRDDLYHRAATILGDADTAPYVWGCGFHWYMSDSFDNVQAVHDAFPDKGLIFTEGCQEGGPHPDSWAVAERYARSVINDLRRWTQGWIDWNLALDLQGGPNHVGNFCSAPALVDTQNGRFSWQPSYHVLGHFAAAVPPGSVRILSAAGLDELDHVAFERPDGQLVLLVLNDSDHAVDWRLGDADGDWAITTPAHAVQSWLL